MSELAAEQTNLARLRHDLRTPLNQIIGYAELLLEDTADAGHAGYAADLEKIRNAANALLGSINDNLTDDRLASMGGFTDSKNAQGNVQVEPVGERQDASGNLSASGRARIVGRILVVDDDAGNRDVLVRHLEREGHVIFTAVDGHAALERLLADVFDLVLLDMIMPALDGYGTLMKIKSDPALRDVPVIMISALDELGSVVRCIEGGAEDYLPKPFNATLLRARIGAGLEKKRFRDQERRYLETIERTQKRLRAELTEAENYVRSILPAPITAGRVRADWRLIPSTELGGDSFGYHWIDHDHFALYLLDVCGHGVGAALLSVTAINVLRNAALPRVDFRDPGVVLTALNEAFLMEKQNDMYFTIWYGVWHPPTRTLRFATAGHPPALLARPQPDQHRQIELLGGKGMLLGGMSGTIYESLECRIDAPAQLYLVSDGTYEIATSDGTMMSFDQFEQFFMAPAGSESGSELDRLFAHAKQLHGPGPLADDFSIVRFDL